MTNLTGEIVQDVVKTRLPDNEVFERQERFLALLTPVSDNLSRFVQALVRDREEARDIVAEAICTAWEHFDNLRHEAQFLSWIFTIARRIVYRNQRKKRLWGWMDSTAALKRDTMSDTGLSPEQNADLRLLYDALELLPVKMRETLVLSDVFDFDLKTIADIQGEGLSAVKQRVKRGREQLQQLLHLR